MRCGGSRGQGVMEALGPPAVISQKTIGCFQIFSFLFLLLLTPFLIIYHFDFYRYINYLNYLLFGFYRNILCICIYKRQNSWVFRAVRLSPNFVIADVKLDLEL